MRGGGAWRSGRSRSMSRPAACYAASAFAETLGPVKPIRATHYKEQAMTFLQPGKLVDVETPAGKGRRVTIGAVHAAVYGSDDMFVPWDAEAATTPRGEWVLALTPTEPTRSLLESERLVFDTL